MPTAHKAFNLYVLTISFVILLFVGTIIKLIPLSFDHAVYYCRKAIQHTLLSFPHPLPDILVLTFFSIIFIGTLLFCIYYLRTKKFVNSHLKEKIPLLDIELEKRILDKVDLVNNSKKLSFCYGLIHPRICISTALVSSLSHNELEVVLFHEYAHLQNRDPLKMMIIKSFTSMFFFIPVLNDMQNYFMLAKEIDADREVLKDDKNKSHLKSALSKILNSSSSTFNVAGFSESTILEERIFIVTGYKKKIPIKISFQSLIISFISIISLFTLIKVPVYAIETTGITHEYFICRYGDQCTKTCTEDATVKESPFTSTENYSHINNTIIP